VLIISFIYIKEAREKYARASNIKNYLTVY